MPDSSFLESLFNPVDQDKENRYLAIEDARNADRRQSLKAAQTKYDRNAEFLDAHGELPEPSSEPGGLVKLLDILDTPHQWVTGAVGKLAGAEGYKDESLLGAAGKGAKDNVYVAKLLREQPWFKEHPFVRGAAGFAGDVLLDPLTYLSFGEGAAARLGGAAVSDKAIGAAGTPLEIAERIRQGAHETAKAKFMEQYAPLLKDATTVDETAEVMKLVEGRAGLEAQQTVYNKFKDARDLAIQARKWKQAGVVEVAQTGSPQMRSVAELLEPELATKAKEIQTAFGLANPDDINQIFKPKAIRFTNPFAGLTTHGKLPIFHTREADIPMLTAASQKMYRALDNAYYGSVHKVGQWMDVAKEGAKTSPMLALADGAFTALKGGHEKLVNIGSLLSRRVQASGALTGSRAALEDMTENERARVALLKMTSQEGAFHGRKVLKFEDAPQMFEDASRALQKKEPIAALDDIRNKYNAIEPGKGDSIANFAGFVKSEFDRLGKEAQDKGLIDSVLNGYLMHMYDFTGGAPKSEFHPNFAKTQSLFKTGAAGGTDFTFDKVFQTMEEAKLHGLKPDENLLHIYVARRYWQERILAEKDFMDRLAYTHAMPEKAYNILASTAADVASAERQKAARALASLDLVQDPTKFEGGYVKNLLPEGMSFEVYKKIKQSAADIKDPFHEEALTMGRTHGFDFSDREAAQMATLKHVGTDEILSPDSYMRIKAAALDPTHDLHDAAMRQAKYMGLKFDADPSEMSRITAQYEAFKATMELHPGRQGERVYARAGASTISDLASKHFLKTATEEDKKLWSGLLPQSLVDAIHESYATYDVIKRQVYADADSPATKAMKGVLNFFSRANRIMKMGAISIWPAYYARNYTSAPFQGLESASALGEQLNLFNIWRAHKAISSGAGLRVPSTGEVISAAQLHQELAAANIFYKLNDTTDLLASMGDMMEQMTKSPGLMATLPGLKSMAKKDHVWENLSENWAGVKKGLALTDGAWSKLKTFTEKIEAHGRAHLYYNLRAAGYDATSAAAQVNRLLVDYAHGKTGFEKNILNNVFFFYSFSRGQATNNFMAMMRKPGALTTQLHAHHAISEMLSSPDAFYSDPDYEAQIQSTRTKESLATYIGDNPKTGLPKFVTQTGLPIEDTAKWLNIAYPRTWGEAIHAGFDSAHRSMQLTASQLNPWMKWPLEVLYTGQNSFFDRPITDRQLRNVPKWERDLPGILHYPFSKVPDSVWKGLDKVTQDVLGGKDNGDGTFTVDPYRLSVLTYLVPAASRILDTRRALTKAGVEPAPKVLRLLSGVQINELDPESSSVFDKLKRQTGYINALGYAESRREREIADKYGDDNDEEN